MTKEKLKNELYRYSVPRHRVARLNKNNLLWLVRNVGKRNSERENFREVYSSLRSLVDCKEFKN